MGLNVVDINIFYSPFTKLTFFCYFIHVFNVFYVVLNVFFYIYGYYTYWLVMQEVVSALSDLKQGVEELRRSKTLKYVLATLLSIGNCLNNLPVS